MIEKQYSIGHPRNGGVIFSKDSNVFRFLAKTFRINDKYYSSFINIDEFTIENKEDLKHFIGAFRIKINTYLNTDISNLDENEILGLYDRKWLKLNPRNGEESLIRRLIKIHRLFYIFNDQNKPICFIPC